MPIVTHEKKVHDTIRRYPRLVAHMICESLGYFTPVSAANAILRYKSNEPYYCEMYSHMVMIRSKRTTGKENDYYNDDLIFDIQKDFLQWSFENRHRHKGYMADYEAGKRVVQRELEGNGPEFASWF